LVAGKLSDYCQAPRLLPEEQSEFRPDRGITYMTSVVHALQELDGRQGFHWFSSPSTFRRHTILVTAVFCGRYLLFLACVHRWPH